MRCVIFNSRKEADPWIQLTHRGLNQGAGMLAWDGQVGARYDERQKGHRDMSLKLLDFVKEQGILSENAQTKIEEGKFPITTLNRLLSTPYVRKKLGIEKEQEEIKFLFPKDEVAKGLGRVVEDLASREITVSDLKKQDQRIDYINQLDSTDLPSPSSELPYPTSIEDLMEQTSILPTVINSSSKENLIANSTAQENESPSPTSSDSSASTSFTSRSQAAAFSSRKTLIPKSCKIPIKQRRVHDLFRELKQLDLNDYSNAGAVMLRVFIELSVDHFVEVKLEWKEQQTQNSKLKDKLNAVVQFLEKEGIMTKNELALIRKAATGDGMLAASVKSMNQYIHNRYYSPVASELVVVWDDFQPFIQKVWELVE